MPRKNARPAARKRAQTLLKERAEAALRKERALRRGPSGPVFSDPRVLQAMISAMDGGRLR